MMFDFFRSVQPNQIIFDTETHILSAVRFRDLYLKPDYVRATYWLAHMHGLNASRNWVWGRVDSGEPLFDRLGKHYAGINSQQPAVLNELHATMIDLNTYSEEITAIQQLRKPLRVYYSLPNAISRRDYMNDVTKTYESLYFDGIPLGFVTDSILELEDPADWEAILIRKTEMVTVDEFNAIQSYLKKGGTVIIDTESLKQNEYGVPHKKLSSGNGTLIRVESMTDMHSKALGLLEDKGLMPDVTITQECERGSGTCVWRSIKTDKGNYVLSLVNIGKNDTKIQIGLKGKSTQINCKDMINGMAVNSATTLKPNDVLFFEISRK
jgi:beta-galactosidase